MTFLLADQVRLTMDEAIELLDQYPCLTLAHYDRGPSSGFDEVGAPEIGRLIVIEALNQRVAAGLVCAARSAPWHAVPLDARLEDADPEADLYWAAGQLHDHFDDIAGVGLAIASKLLRLKRPAFFPILDSRVQHLYDEPARRAYLRSERARREFPPPGDRLYWAAIRKDLMENRESLEQLRRKLVGSPDPHRRQLASLPSVRLLDMLIWTHETSTRSQPITDPAIS